MTRESDEALSPPSQSLEAPQFDASLSPLRLNRGPITLLAAMSGVGLVLTDFSVKWGGITQCNVPSPS